VGLEVTRIKLLDCIKIRAAHKRFDVGVMVVLKDDKVEDVRILGICIFPGIPTNTREPRNEEEKRALDMLAKIRKKEKILSLLGKEITLKD